MTRRIRFNNDRVAISDEIKVSGSVIMDDGKNRKEFTNIIVRCGAHYMASAVSGKFTPFGGVPTNLYLGLGNANATNSGVPGPSTGTPIPTGGSWNGPSYNDWRLSNHISGLWISADSINIVNEMIVIFGTFNDALFDYGDPPTPVEIREVVVAIGDREPIADPFDIPAEKPYSIISRAVFFNKVANPSPPPVNAYGDDPYIKSPGGNLTMRYQYRFG